MTDCAAKRGADQHWFRTCDIPSPVAFSKSVFEGQMIVEWQQSCDSLNTSKIIWPKIDIKQSHELLFLRKSLLLKSDHFLTNR